MSNLVTCFDQWGSQAMQYRESREGKGLMIGNCQSCNRYLSRNSEHRYQWKHAIQETTHWQGEQASLLQYLQPGFHHNTPY